jgi:hypothetical protein
MSKQKDETRANIVAHVMQAGAAGEMDQTELCKAAYRVADHMARSDGDKPVAKDMSPETATRLLNAVAGLSEHAGLTARGDEEVKSVVTPNSNEPVSTKGDKEDKEPTLSDVMGAIDKMNKRMDKLEKRGYGEEDDPHKGKPEDLAADSSFKVRSDAERRNNLRSDDWRNENHFAEFQAKADAVASLFGQRAARPIAGELLGSFKRRSIREWQSLSPTYKDVDMRVVQVADAVAFDVAVDDVLKCADAEGRRPTRVPVGHLIERVEERGGHRFVRFYGQPKSWMDQFMPRAQRVKSVRQMASDGRIEGTLYQKG